MTRGYFCLILHAHLPFVRHKDDPTVMEQAWLHEAILETYVPLLTTFESLRADGVQFRCTVSLSAPLIQMLIDPLLQERFEVHLTAMQELAWKELERTQNEPPYHALARLYAGRLAHARAMWDRCSGNLVTLFRDLALTGHLELITSTATHGFFPLMGGDWESIRAQVHTAAEHFERVIGWRSPGMWLGECGYVPGVDEILREAAVRYFIVDTHAIENADHASAYGCHAPVYTPAGVAAFARDPETSQQVWSAESGYPGHPNYRDFYRDIGFDLPMDYIGPYVHPEGIRMATGFKYHAITHDRLHDKWVYNEGEARRMVGEHAMDFRLRLQELSRELEPGMDRPPVIVSPYDAELYGHWWFEGPWWLDILFRQIHHDQDEVSSISPAMYLDRHPTNQMTTPSASSWGRNGYNEYWLNPSNAWVYRHLHAIADRMRELATRFPDAEGLRERALNQAARELLLAQSSDWAFIMRTGTTVEYAERRTNDHVRRFNRLYDDLLADEVDEAWLAEVEAEDNIFPAVDWRLWK